MQIRSIYIDTQCLVQKGKKTYDYIENNKIYFVLIVSIFQKDCRTFSDLNCILLLSNGKSRPIEVDSQWDSISVIST